MDIQSEKKQQLQWINCAKTVAIFAVLIDHTHGILYQNTRIKELSFFSVSLFILISGITSYISISHSNLNWWKAYLRSIKNIVIAYLISSAIYLLVRDHTFSLYSYVNCIIHFSAARPLYYVALYLQLMITGRILYKILMESSKYRYGYVIEIVGFFIVLGIAVYTTNYTQIMDIYGGGGKLLGGTYLILYYLGMVAAKEGCFKPKSSKKNVVIGVCSSCAFFYFGLNLERNRKVLDSLVPMGDGLNPPSITYMLLAIFVLFAIFSFCSLLEQLDITDKLLSIEGWIGKHTLYIFMYHRLFLDYFMEKYLLIKNIWIKRVVYFILMIGLSILLEYVINYILKKLRKYLVEMTKYIKMKNID